MVYSPHAGPTAALRPGGIQGQRCVSAQLARIVTSFAQAFELIVYQTLVKRIKYFNRIHDMTPERGFAWRSREFLAK